MMWSQQTLDWSSIAKRIVKSSKKATEAEGYEWIVPRPRKMMDESLSRIITLLAPVRVFLGRVV